MNKRILLRLCAALVALLMASLPALGEMMDTASAIWLEETQSMRVDAEVEEVSDQSPEAELPVESEAELSYDEPVIMEDYAAAAEADAATAETPDATEAPAVAAIDTSVPGKWVYSATATASSETWQDVDLSRAPGFTGKLATVTGTLTLSNVTIEGQPARSVNLTDQFDLQSGASIVIVDDAALKLNLSAVSLDLGLSKALKATYNGKAVKADRVKWATSAKRLATVNKKGKVAGKGRGVATVTASYKGQRATCYVNVTGVVAVQSVSLKDKKLTMGLGGTARLKAALKPANPDDPTLTWTSSNPGVVSVDESGNLAGLAAGKATVTVTASNGRAAACKVIVKTIKPKSARFQRLYVTMHPGETYQTALTTKPANASYLPANYASSDTAVATVDDSGVITAVGVGTATISVSSAAYPKVRDTCKVCVIEAGAAQLAGLKIGINPGHQAKMIKKRYPMAPGSHSYGPGVKVGAGGVSTHQAEYNVVLKIGLKLKRILEEHGAEVVITRTTNDVMLTNIDRAKMLNEAGVDVALQLHNNSCSNPSKTGVSSYYRTNSEWSDENKALAIQLSKYMSSATGFANRGINPYNNYMSLNWTTTPSVLLEMGYLSNSSDDHKLAKDSFREKLAYGIYQGLCAYFGR